MAEAQIRVLQIIGTMDVGGAETMIMNIYRNIDRSRIQFDFFLSTNKECYYNSEIKNLGGRIYYASPKSKHPIKFSLELQKVIRNNKYSVVHIHTSNAMAAIPAAVARIFGVSNVIVHSHNSQDTGNPMLHKLMRIFLNRIATNKYSCSDKASEWMYGKNKSEAVIINNPVDCNLFKYRESIRLEMRKSLGLSSEKVYVHVGRFSNQKNHRFLIEVFNCINKMDKNTKLLLVGTGELEQSIKYMVQDYGLNNSVIFLGIRNDVNKVLNACDAFVFTSLYEGLPLTLVEAQANGLPCYISDTITEQISVTDLVQRLSLNDNPNLWAQKILEDTKMSVSRDSYSAQVFNTFDVKAIANALVYKYCE